MPMGRPKVPPHQRRRVSQACTACRTLKKKCSGRAPCIHCVRRGTGSSCSIPSHHASLDAGLQNLDATDLLADRSSPQQSTLSPERTQRRSSNDSTGMTIAENPTRGSDPAPVNQTLVSPSNQSQSCQEADTVASSILPANSQPRMLLNLRGERAYIGRGGSQSLLQCVRSHIASQIGISSFSRVGTSDIMHETQPPKSNTSVCSPEEMSLETKLLYGTYFDTVTGGLIDPFYPQELEALLMLSAIENPQKRSIVELVIAIGLQCESTVDTLDREVAYFTSAQSQAFAGMLEEHNIDIVRIFLIMAFYLLGQSRRNTAFVYLGIAARIATALGLHSRETYTDMSDSEQQLRLRVWMSLRVMDIPVSSVLGRPPATGGVHSDLHGLVDELGAVTKDNGIVCLVASYKIVSLISSIIDRVYDRKEISIALIEDFLQQLKDWSRELPQFLRTSPSSPSLDPPDPLDYKGGIGRIHVSCLYYFAVTLVTRPILISTLTQQQAPDTVSSRLAAACLEAATLTVQTCMGARKHNLLKTNMSTLMTMVFPSGLVLGFEMFAKQAGPYGIEAAFHGARELLGFLGTKSSLASLYYDMLTSLWNVILDRRKHERSHQGSAYISRLFDPGTPLGGDESDHPINESIAALPSNEQNDQPDTPLGNGDQLFDNTIPLDSGEMFLDWDSLEITQWDTFPYINA